MSQNSTSGCGGSAPLFPATFWSKLVWKTSTSPSPPLSTTSESHLPDYGKVFHPNLMIGRTRLHEYLLQEYNYLIRDSEDEQSLDDGM